MYVMQCMICGRKKEMLSSTIRYKKGITHKLCGKGIKTKDLYFYNRWHAMRTRTENPNYEHAEHYSLKGVDSDEFKYFIDFYDKMYNSYKELADVIGKENVSLERIDVNKGYTSENCMWINKHDQPKNTSRIVTFKATFPDAHEEICRNVNQFAREHNLNSSCIHDVLNHRLNKHKGFKFERVAS